MADRTEQLVGTLFRVLAVKGHTEAREALLDEYQSAATVDRGSLTDNLASELVGVLNARLGTDEQIDVLAAAVDRVLDRFAAVVETVPVAVLVVDERGSIRLWNDGAERIFGWSESEMRHRSYPSALAVTSDGTETFLARLRDGNRFDGVETRHRRKDGSILDVRIWAASSRTDDDGFGGGTVVISDITEQNQREQRLSVLNRVLRHNVRNDVTVVRGHLEMLAEDLPEDDEHVEAISDRLSDIVKLSEAARYSGQLNSDGVGEHGALDVASVVADRVDRLRTEYPSADIRVTAPESEPAAAHKLLPYALDNVLENALEHNDADVPRVEIDVSASEDAQDHVLVRIADNGPGLPEAEHEVLTSETETPLSHSDGVGLWLTRWIVRTSNGTLRVDDDPTGTRVTIRLPGADDA
jgi:PAS domain S-box-containing protein